MQLRWDEKASFAQIAAIAAQIDATGFCRIDGFISRDELMPLVSIAESAVDRAKGEYIAFSGPDAFTGTVWARMISSPPLRFLCESLYGHAHPENMPKAGFYQIFRCLKGQSSRKHSFYFHFDSYVVTIILPIVIPQSGSAGNLIMFPAIRPIRRTYLRNVIDKLFSDLFPMQLFYRMRAGAPRSGAISIRMEPGSAVLFWGYRSLHTNEPCDPDKLRATALLHFGNPHRGASASRLRRR